MSKISLEQLQDALTESKIEPKKQEEILENIKKIIEEEKEGKERITRPKAQLGVILLDENQEIKNDNISALIYEIGAGESHDNVLTNVKKAVTEFNNTKKGQKNPVKSVQEAFRVIKPKTLKANKLKKKVKEPVRCLISSNKI